jgi:hypothetical protein
VPTLKKLTGNYKEWVLTFFDLNIARYPATNSEGEYLNSFSYISMDTGIF